MRESCTLVFSSSPNYVREVLGHGGVNVFPCWEGECGQCRLLVRVANLPSDDKSVECPKCHATVRLTSWQSFVNWSYGRPLDTSCRAIELAAKAQLDSH